MSDQPIQPKMYIGVLLSVNDFNTAIVAHLGQYMQYISIADTIRVNLHNYFYSEALPIAAPVDTYLGGMVAYSVNQETLAPETRSFILNKMAELQWVLHDYISSHVKAILGPNAVRETEYYYVLDQSARLMVYIPVDQVWVNQFGAVPVPEAAVVYSCYNTLPMAKKLAYSKAVLAIRQS